MRFSQHALIAGISLLLFYAGLVLFTQLSLLANLSLTSVPFWLALLSLVAGNWALQKSIIGTQKWVGPVVNIVLCLTIIEGSLLFGHSFLDTSFDANWYHQDAIYLLHEGWKPAYHELAELETSYSHKYLNHFPMASWLAGSAVFAFTGSIETAKGLNLMLFFSVLGCGIGLFAKCFPSRQFLSFPMALLLACNPILLLNISCGYADGQVAALITLSICLAILKILDWQLPIGLLALLAAALLANLKFTSAVYAGMLVFACLGYLSFRKIIPYSRAILVLFAWGCFAYGIMGFSPYMSNLLRKGHPLYPLSENAENVFDKKAIYPSNFMDKSTGTKLVYSLFAKPKWSRNPDSCEIKNLFGNNPLSYYESAMPEVATLGPLAPEILLLLIIPAFLAFLRLSPKTKTDLLLLMLLLGASIAINPEAWVLRYVPQIWLFWVLGIAWLFGSNQKWTKPIAWMLLLACLMNAWLLGRTNLQGALAHSKEQAEQFEMIKANPNKYLVYSGWTKTFKRRLATQGIDTTHLVYLPDTASGVIAFKHSLGGCFKEK